MPNPMKETVGRVSLVGAGPGDIDHLTLGAMKAIQSAQAVLYDARDCLSDYENDAWYVHHK